MTIWHVRPNINHAVTRNGAYYDTAWGGWSEIVWGGAGVKAGDTLYVCGAHSYSAQITVGNHGATSGSPVTIRGDYATESGSITFTTGFLFVGWNYTQFHNLTISAGTLYCLYLYGAILTGITIQGCTLNGGTAQPMINMSGANGLSYVDITIDANDFIGGSGSTLGSAINWVVAGAAAVSSLTRPVITNNRFTGCSSARGVIVLWVQDAAGVASKMADVVITDNTFTDCKGVTIEAFGPASYGRHTGIKVLDNAVYNQQRVGIIGGVMSISSFGPSLTDAFGSNLIARNKGYGIDGPAGFCNVFYGSYRIFGNRGEDITTGTIDGTGILFDLGCKDCIAYGNRFSRLTGMPGIYYSGNGITVLAATNIEVYGNLIEDAYCGIHFGNKGAGQSSNIHNNTFLRCAMGVDMLATADMGTNLVRNNVFTGIGATASVRVSAGTWIGEANNCFYGFGAPSGHTLAGTTITASPLIGSDGRPLTGSPLIAAGTYLGGKGVDYKTFQNPPCIGAYEYVRPRAVRA